MAFLPVDKPSGRSAHGPWRGSLWYCIYGMVRTTYVLQSTPANLLIVRYFFGLSVGRYEFMVFV